MLWRLTSMIHQAEESVSRITWNNVTNYYLLPIWSENHKQCKGCSRSMIKILYFTPSLLIDFMQRTIVYNYLCSTNKCTAFAWKGKKLDNKLHLQHENLGTHKIFWILNFVPHLRQSRGISLNILFILSSWDATNSIRELLKRLVVSL